ncbi:MAG: hypothetical protein WBG50_09900 [Desulfomonilaceae bacterium]
MMPKIYLVPLGFSPEQKPYLQRIKTRLVQLGYEIFDPWEQPFSEAIHKLIGSSIKMPSVKEKLKRLPQINLSHLCPSCSCLFRRRVYQIRFKQFLDGLPILRRYDYGL